MFKSILLGACVLAGVHAQAVEANSNLAMQVAQSLIRPFAVLNWNVGSTADYNMQGGFINGTIHSQVREATAMGYWIQQDMNMGFLGSQKVEIHMNKENGEVIEILVNGQKQKVPDASNMEIRDSRREKVRVPKGEFDSVYLKIFDKSSNEESETWVNPAVVPMGGMLKTIAPSQMGKITIELTDFKI